MLCLPPDPILFLPFQTNYCRTSKQQKQIPVRCFFCFPVYFLSFRCLWQLKRFLGSAFGFLFSRLLLNLLSQPLTAPLHGRHYLQCPNLRAAYICIKKLRLQCYDHTIFPNLFICNRSIILYHGIIAALIYRLHQPVTKCIFQNQISGYLIFGFVFSQKYRFPFFHRLFQQLLYLCIFPLHRVYLKIDLL